MRFFGAALGLAVVMCVIGGGASRAASSPASPLALPVDHQLTYNCQWSPRVGHGVGWTGTLTMRVNAEGVISGTYRSTSVRPDPFYGRTITVSGGLTGGNNIRLSFGISPNVTVRGVVVKNGIQGSTSYNGGSVEFLASLTQ